MAKGLERSLLFPETHFVCGTVITSILALCSTLLHPVVVCVGTMCKAIELGICNYVDLTLKEKTTLACPIQAITHCLAGLTWVGMLNQEEKGNLVTLMETWTNQLVISLGLDLGREVVWEQDLGGDHIVLTCKRLVGLSIVWSKFQGKGVYVVLKLCPYCPQQKDSF